MPLSDQQILIRFKEARKSLQAIKDGLEHDSLGQEDLLGIISNTYNNLAGDPIMASNWIFDTLWILSLFIKSHPGAAFINLAPIKVYGANVMLNLANKGVLLSVLGPREYIRRVDVCLACLNDIYTSPDPRVCIEGLGQAKMALDNILAVNDHLFMVNLISVALKGTSPRVIGVDYYDQIIGAAEFINADVEIVKYNLARCSTWPWINIFCGHKN